jgi:hypothetical protein
MPASCPASLTRCLTAVLLLAQSTAARADVVPMPPPGQRFLRTTVRVEGLKRPDVVLLAWPRRESGEEVHTHVAFEAGSVEATFHLDTSLDGAPLKAMPKAAYDAWRADMGRAVQAQRTACFERGEGCPHPSRFTPRFLPPQQGVIDCGFSLRIPQHGPEGGPEETLERLAVRKLDATTCEVGPVETAPRRSTSGGVPGCGAGGLAGPGLGFLTLGALTLARLRRRARAPGR